MNGRVSGFMMDVHLHESEYLQVTAGFKVPQLFYYAAVPISDFKHFFLSIIKMHILALIIYLELLHCT